MISGRSSRVSAANQSPAAFRLPYAQRGQWHVNVAQIDADLVQSGLVSSIPRYVALTLPMADQPQTLGPVLHRHPPLRRHNRLCQQLKLAYWAATEASCPCTFPRSSSMRRNVASA